MKKNENLNEKQISEKFYSELVKAFQEHISEHFTEKNPADYFNVLIESIDVTNRCVMSSISGTGSLPDDELKYVADHFLSLLDLKEIIKDALIHSGIKRSE